MKRDTLIQFYKKYESTRAEHLPASAQTRIKARILENLEVALPPRPHYSHQTAVIIYARFALVAIYMLILLTGTTHASASAVPGDILYPVKRAIEDTRVKLASSPETKAKLQVQFAEERLLELETVERQSPLKQAAPDITPNATPPASPPTTIEAEDQESPAESSAREEVSKAIRSLEKTQADLRQQGKEHIASDLAVTIHTFNNRAHKKRASKESPQREQKNQDSRRSDTSKSVSPTQIQQESDHPEFLKHGQRKD
jgi:type IV secretory pathway VirB10-like protein